MTNGIVPVICSLCPSIYLRRLKIPRTQVCTGSSPVPSISYNQSLTSHLWVIDSVKSHVRTQILRSRLQKTSITAKVLSPYSSIILAQHLFLLSDRRGKRGAREKKLPQTAKRVDVASVATLAIPAFSKASHSPQFYFEVRNKCVISRCHHSNSCSHNIRNCIALGIANRLLLTIPAFINLFQFIRGSYGNDS